MKRLLLSILLLALAALPSVPAAAQTTPPFARLETDVQYLTGWMQLLYDRVDSERRNVPQAARIYGYAGVTAYAALLPSPSAPGLKLDSLNGFPTLPEPEAGQAYDGVASLIGAMRVALPELMAPLPNSGRVDTTTNFNTAESNATLRAVENLASRQYGERLRAVDRATVERSLAYGESVGRAVAAWAATDGFVETRAMSYEPPVGPGLWSETTPGQHAMEPYWGTLRPLALPTADTCAMPLDVPFDEDVSATLHAQAMEVYLMSKALTDDQRAIAAFWDERVGESGTASGHWLYVANVLVDELNLGLSDAAALYAALGVTMADAFISAWHVKYEENLLRPETYINTYIDPDWRPLRQAPPFPAYPSGHAVLGGAVAETLTTLFGPMAYTDRYGVQYGLQARTYTSFEAAAYENALSRLYGGVHYRVDMENGLEQGRCVGQTVVAALMS